VANSFEYRFIKAAKRVGNNYPYYSPVIPRLRFRNDSNNIETMGINCSLAISFNESFTNKLEDIHLENIILHEILHYINGHHARYQNNLLRDTLPHFIHNIAMDLEINEFIPDLPDSAFKARDFGLPERRSYEEYLGIINREMPPKLKALIESKDFTMVEDLQMDGYDEMYQEILYNLIKECDAGTETASDDVNRKIVKKKYPWEQVFQNIVATKVTEIAAGYNYRTFEKTNRRYAHFSDIILPQYFDRKTKMSLAIIMDISGSMSENVNKMYGVMKSIIDILDLEIDITILEVNASVANIMYNFDLKRESIASKDGGGTDMGAGLNYIQDNNINPDLVIVMTDSYTPWPNPPILSDKTVVLTDNPKDYNGPYPMFPVIF